MSAHAKVGVFAEGRVDRFRSPEMKTHKLKFTGSCTLTEFEERCEQQDYWYHSFYFDNDFHKRGSYDIGRDIDSYGFPADMNGMSVLDVGTGSGWFATYFEQRGADVTAVDVRGYCDFDLFGKMDYPDPKLDKKWPDYTTPDGRAIYFSPVSQGFWIMKQILGLKANYVNARIYELCPELFGGKKFDLVFLGALLMHVRDPIGALAAARTVCGNLLIANSLRLNDFVPGLPAESARHKPLMTLLTSSAGGGFDWWAPDHACLIKWFEAAGFSEVDADRTVNLTVDKPFELPNGMSDGAANQTLYLMHARV